MAMKKYWFILLAGVVFPLFAGENLRVPDIRALGMGGNGVTLSSVYNPALLEFSPQSISYRRLFISLPSDMTSTGKTGCGWHWQRG